MTDHEQAELVERTLGNFATCAFCYREVSKDKMALRQLDGIIWDCSNADFENLATCAEIGWRIRQGHFQYGHPRADNADHSSNS